MYLFEGEDGVDYLLAEMMSNNKERMFQKIPLPWSTHINPFEPF
jgi:hypothetical protein